MTGEPNSLRLLPAKPKPVWKRATTLNYGKRHSSNFSLVVVLTIN